MKILILAAMEKEISLLLNLFSNYSESNFENTIYYKGKIGNHEVILAKCGIGKVNSALCTYKLLKAFTPELVINSGVAGGAAIPIASVLVADKVAYHDVWCGPGSDYGQADGLPLFMKPDEKILEITKNIDSSLIRGLICSGDKFISTAQELKNIRMYFPEVKAVDMESASIAQVCSLNNIPFTIIRVVSDTPGEGENISQYQDFWSNAPQKTFTVLKKILEVL